MNGPLTDPLNQHYNKGDKRNAVTNSNILIYFI